MRRTVEGVLVMSRTTSAAYAAVIFTNPCHSLSFLNALLISVINRATYPDACSICLAKEGSKNMGLLTLFCIVEALGQRNGCKTYLLFCESLQDLPRGFLMSESIFVLIATAKLPGNLCKTLSESTSGIISTAITAHHLDFWVSPHPSLGRFRLPIR